MSGYSLHRAYLFIPMTLFLLPIHLFSLSHSLPLSLTHCVPLFTLSTFCCCFSRFFSLHILYAIQELELRIETQKQTLSARDESIKKLLEMLQTKGMGMFRIYFIFFVSFCLSMKHLTHTYTLDGGEQSRAENLIHVTRFIHEGYDELMCVPEFSKSYSLRIHLLSHVNVECGWIVCQIWHTSTSTSTKTVVC